MRESCKRFQRLDVGFPKLRGSEAEGLKGWIFCNISIGFLLATRNIIDMNLEVAKRTACSSRRNADENYSWKFAG